MSPRLRLGIVGFDHPHVLRFAPMLAAHPDVDLEWISADGPNRAAAEAMARDLGTRFVAEPAGGIDAAYLAVRPGRHLEVVRRLAPEGVAVRNPAFDVTPNRYVSAIVCERGVARAPYLESLRGLAEK